MPRIPALMFLLSATLLGCACSKSPIERQQERSQAQDPVGVELKVRTKDGKRTFFVGEKVQLEEFYTSKYPKEWHMEVLEGVNNAAMSDVIHISDGKSVWNVDQQYTIVCCFSRHVWLDLQPTRVPYPLTNNRDAFVRNPEYREFSAPPRPGKFDFYLTTERLFSAGESTLTYTGKGRSVTSNVVTINVKQRDDALPSRAVPKE